MERQDKNDIPMKIHQNHQFKEMLESGTAKIIQYKYIPYTNVSTYIVGDIVNGNVSGVVSNMKFNLDFEILTEPEPRSIDTESRVADLPLDAEPAAVVAEIQPDTVPVSRVEEMPMVAEPVVTAAELPMEVEPVSTAAVLPEAEPIATVAELPTEAEPVTTTAALPPEAEPVTTAAELPPEAEPITTSAELPTEAKPIATTAELPSEAEPIATAAPQPTEAAPQVAPDGTAMKIPQGFANINVLKSVGYEPAQDPSKDDSAALPPPYISFITFNRLGLTIKNLTNLLESDESFELNIIDCNSKDNSWDYIQSLTDSRIKSKIRFDKNYGPIYAINYALSRRKPNQYFFAMDSDTFIITKNWISRYMEVFEAFPEVGLLGLMRDNPYPRYLPPIIPRMNGNIAYLELKNADINAIMDFIPGQLQCLSPKLINEIGYWSEENGFGDAELSPRIVHYTDFKVGFLTTVDIDMTQKITCNECRGKEFCTLSRSINDCFSFSKKYNKNESFVEKNTWKFKQSFQELKEGQRTAYCASIHDPESMKTHIYNSEWANDNFNHYLFNSN